MDIVARHGDTILFVEVKTRRSTSFGVPEESITPAKTYLEEHDMADSHWRTDLISAVMDSTGRVLPLRHMKNGVKRDLC